MAQDEARDRGVHEVAGQINEWIGAGTVSDELMHQIVWALTQDQEIEDRLHALLDYCRELERQEREEADLLHESEASLGDYESGAAQERSNDAWASRDDPRSF